MGEYRDQTATGAATSASASAAGRQPSPEVIYREVFNHIADPVFITDKETLRILDCNEAATRKYGYSSAEFLSMSPVDLHPAEERELARERIRGAHEKPTRREYTHVARDGTAYRVEVQASDCRFGQREAVLAVVHDISEQVRALESLRESEANFRAVAETAASAIYILADRRLLYVNPAMERITGYSRQELLQMDPFQLVHPDSREMVMQRAAARVRGESQPDHYEFQGVDRAGAVHWFDLSVSVIHFQGKTATLSTAVDITERRALEEQLRQSQKMEAVGRLAGGVAHDFNNLLMVIRGNTDLLLESLPATNPMHREAHEIRKAADRAMALTNQLLAISRKQVLVPRLLDLNTVITSMDNLLHRMAGDDIQVRVTLGEGLGQVKADLGQIEQVLINLAINGRDAMPDGGSLTIATSHVQVSDPPGPEHASLKPGTYVCCAVSDTGGGMDAETSSRIFDPFYTTKDTGQGAGLGLSAVYGIVKQSGGHIAVRSAPGQGTTFTIFLPRAREEAAPAAAPRTDVAKGKETILVVEDEDGVRDLVKHFLRRKGYTVLEARREDEALAHCKQHEGAIHLLLTDVMLQRTSGRELALQLARIRPEMKVLYMSGYTEESRSEAPSGGETAFLQKPFTSEGLIGKVRDVLDRPAK